MRKRGLVALVMFLAPLASWAGPPFLTDDPDPIDYRTFELIPAYFVDRSRDGEEIDGPIADFNYGIAPDMHLNLQGGWARLLPAGGPSESGFSDLRMALKWRFHKETDGSPEIAIYPAVEFPTGNAEKGLGNGQAWYQFPLWLEKNWGDWSSYGGGGWTLNRAPGARDFFYGGWELQRKLGDSAYLGAEVFSQGSTGAGQAGSTVFNFGGGYTLNSRAMLIFTFGHSFAGESQALGYIGIDFTW
ncbi:MAG: hypothetical protein ACM3ZT_05265 [Bacillota bacterium]